MSICPNTPHWRRYHCLLIQSTSNNSQVKQIKPEQTSSPKMLLQKFICFYYYIAAIHPYWIASGSRPEAVSWLSTLEEESVHQKSRESTGEASMVRLQFDSPAFLFEDVELECAFQLNNKQLYSIKWYKDEQEFFQYAPYEKPRGVHFESPVYSISNETFRLWLRHVALDTQGIFRCEVSTDAPDFTTYKDHKTLEVYVLPNKSPRITGSRANFQPKGRVDLNCTSPKSKPVSTLQWFINDKLVIYEAIQSIIDTKDAPATVQASSDYLIPYKQVNHSDGLQTKTLRLKFVGHAVNEEHFKSGDMLKCVATYQKPSTNQTNQQWIRRHSKWNPKGTTSSADKPPPAPGSTSTKSGSNASPTRHLTSCTLLAAMLVCTVVLSFFLSFFLSP